MELARHIHAALEATRQLETQLATGDLVGSAALLDKRERILADFRDAHRRSSERDRRTHHGLLEELVRADENLRRSADRSLAEAASRMNRSPLPQSDRTEPLTACLDRKA
jgi:phage shock protein A